MIETKQENYVCALKITKKEMQKIVLKEQETKHTSAGRPLKDCVGSRTQTCNGLYKKYTSDTSGIPKQMIERYPAQFFMNKDDILKAVKILDADE
ncbi:hypothetical protein DSO57_1022171 [Entomophthora muscae]|uniref:Uncharacterized protein n=1 Tax=Entomophthora muscae TaxID=34485 RepID=A0ACC2RUK3_9FUNG|nr:hypothetical protein DSO57_1022171 [Entomophthora muscae]